MSETVRVYINAKAVEVTSPATALDAIQAWDAAAAAAVESGERMITDSRGIAADPRSPVHNGAIFRIVRARPQEGDDSDASFTP